MTMIICNQTECLHNTSERCQCTTIAINKNVPGGCDSYFETPAIIMKMDRKECELCGSVATQFCTCTACREASGEDNNGMRPNDELGEGRWLCDDCCL